MKTFIACYAAAVAAIFSNVSAQLPMNSPDFSLLLIGETIPDIEIRNSKGERARASASYKRQVPLTVLKELKNLQPATR